MQVQVVEFCNIWLTILTTSSPFSRLHFFLVCFTTEQSNAEASLFVKPDTPGYGSVTELATTSKFPSREC